MGILYQHGRETREELTLSQVSWGPSLDLPFSAFTYSRHSGSGQPYGRTMPQFLLPAFPSQTGMFLLAYHTPAHPTLPTGPAALLLYILLKCLLFTATPLFPHHLLPLCLLGSVSSCLPACLLLPTTTTHARACLHHKRTRAAQTNAAPPSSSPRLAHGATARHLYHHYPHPPPGQHGTWTANMPLVTYYRLITTDRFAVASIGGCRRLQHCT